MGIKNLKEQNKSLNVNIIDLLSEFDTTKTKKLTPFLVKLLKESRENRNSLLSDVKRVYKEVLVDYLGRTNLEMLKHFASHLENNRITNMDINSYSNWDQIISETNKADLKLLDKEVSKQIEVIHQDDEWLILKPLSFKSSLAYGSNTKWCTAMKTEPDYFYRYSKNGILIYVINKINGVKYGFNSSPEEFSVWNQTDVRIDSLETIIPSNLLLRIKEFSNLSVHGCNYNKFSDEEISNYMRLQEKFMKKDLYLGVPLVEETAYYNTERNMEEDLMEEPTREYIREEVDYPTEEQSDYRYMGGAVNEHYNFHSQVVVEDEQEGMGVFLIQNG